MSLYVIICHCAWLAMPCRWSDGHRFGFCPVSPAHSECLVRQGLHAWPNPPGFVSAWRTERSLHTKQKWNNFRNLLGNKDRNAQIQTNYQKSCYYYPCVSRIFTSSENCFVLFCLLAGSSHPSEKCRAQSQNGKIQWVADERVPNLNLCVWTRKNIWTIKCLSKSPKTFCLSFHKFLHLGKRCPMTEWHQPRCILGSLHAANISWARPNNSAASAPGVNWSSAVPEPRCRSWFDPQNCQWTNGWVVAGKGACKAWFTCQTNQ